MKSPAATDTEAALDHLSPDASPNATFTWHAAIQSDLALSTELLAATRVPRGSCDVKVVDSRIYLCRWSTDI